MTSKGNDMILHRSIMAFPALMVVAIPAAAADLTFTNGSGTTTTFYGQLNPTFQGVDDGDETYEKLVDNGNSVSRIGIWIDGTLWGNTARFNFETSLGVESTSETNQVDDPPWLDWLRTDIRKLEVVYSGDFGAVWAGQGSMATDGASEVDNSGTSVVGYSSLSDTAGSFIFRDGAALSSTTIGDVFKNFDGTRRFRLRYDTPDLSGFVVSAAAGYDVLSETDDADYYDTALRYGYKDDTFSFNAAIGYSFKDDQGKTTEQVMASASATHVPTGLNLTVATGEQQSDGGQYLYTKIGWGGDVVGFGKTSVSADLYSGSDFSVLGSESSSWGVQAVQQFAEQGLEAYLGYREYAYDGVPSVDYQDIGTVLFGARWKF
jgi:hypothetical protein